MSRGISGNYKQHMDKPWLGEWDLPEKDDMVVEIDYVDKEDVKSDQGTESKMTIHQRRRDLRGTGDTAGRELGRPEDPAL